MENFVSILGILIGVIANCWDFFYEIWPAIAITILFLLYVVSMVITRLLKPMVAVAERRAFYDMAQGKTHSHKVNKSREE